MKLLSIITACATITTSNAFVVAPEGSRVVSTSSTVVEMGLFDFFSDEARQKREEKKRREIEEQEKLQKAIMERRKSPELMEEYERKVAVRRQLRMEGKDDDASQVTMYEDVDSKTLLDGTEGQG